MVRETFESSDGFLVRVADSRYVESLLDRLPDIVFSIKDRAGRYVTMSRACVDRCGLSSKRQAVGKTAFDLFPAPLPWLAKHVVLLEAVNAIVASAAAARADLAVLDFAGEEARWLPPGRS